MRFICCLLFLVFLGCNPRNQNGFNQERVEKLYGSVLRCPDSLSILRGEYIVPIDTSEFDTKGKKIVSLISTECMKCFEQLYQWDKFCNENSEFAKQKIYFVLYDTNVEYFRKVQLPLLPRRENFVFVLDVTNKFIDINNLGHDKSLHTFLLSSFNEIILIGYPLNNRMLKDLYDENIRT